MKSSSTSFHLALRQATSTSQPALKRQALAEAARALVHPRLVLDTPLLDDSHPWKRQALVVADAFEAVTNGMQAPDLWEALDEIPSDSPFAPWKDLVYALYFFYEGLDEAVVARLGRIDEDAPVQPLVRALRTLLAGGPPPAGALGNLVASVAEADPALVQSVQDLTEGLETDLEPLFWRAFGDWLEAVAPVHPTASRQAVLWAWGQLEWRDFDESVLLDLTSALWGRAEAFRLAALGSYQWDPTGASLLWLRFLVTALRDEGRSPSELATGPDWARRFRQAAQTSEGSPSPEEARTWTALAEAWNREVDLRGRPDLRLAAAEPETISTAERPRADGQLDLFL